MDIEGSRTFLRARLVVEPSAPPIAVSTISDAYANAQPGDVIIIQPGTYTESLDLDLSGTASAPITLKAAIPGTVILDGGGTLNTAISGEGQFDVISGFVIQNFASTGYQNEQAAVRTNTGWELSSVTVQDCSGTGIGVFGNDVSLTNVISQDNGSNGIGGSGTTNVTLTDCMSLTTTPARSSPLTILPTKGAAASGRTATGSPSFATAGMTTAAPACGSISRTKISPSSTAKAAATMVAAHSMPPTGSAPRPPSKPTSVPS